MKRKLKRLQKGDKVHRKEGIHQSLQATVLNPSVSFKITRKNETVSIVGFIKIRFDGDSQTYHYPQNAFVKI